MGGVIHRDLFPEGSLQSAEHDGKGNLIATQIRPSGKGRTKQWVVDDSLNMLDKVIGDEFEKDYFSSAFFEGKKIPCISLKGQKVFHSGYELRDKDVHDISILEGLSE